MNERFELPYFLKDFEGVGGVIKQRPEDFFVQEIPLYEPTGDGDHVMIEIEKSRISTLHACEMIATNLGIDKRGIGYAGMKDGLAVARQILTIPFGTPEMLMGFHNNRINVIWAKKHRSKLRMGHLAGNRFIIKIRNVDPMKVVTLKPALDELARRGLPNFFGEQRFGRRNDNDLMGAAFVRGDDKKVLRLLLGDPIPGQDIAGEYEARTYYMAGEYERAIRAWPDYAFYQRRALQRLIQTDDPYQAVMAVDMNIRRLWVTAMQSRIFNSILVKRIDTIDKLMLGDLAYIHAADSCFNVENLAAEQPRADAFEISPTGPMIGRRMSMARYKVREMEQALFNQYDVQQDDFRSNYRDRSHGARRPLRVRVQDTKLESGADEYGPHITIAFTLPPGAYATVLLRELMRNDAHPTDDHHSHDDSSEEMIEHHE